MGAGAELARQCASQNKESGYDPLFRLDGIFIVLCVVGPLGKGGWRTNSKKRAEEDCCAIGFSAGIRFSFCKGKD